MLSNQVEDRVIMSGNEAIGRGAIEAGISLAASYPGTPATEILEYLSENYHGKVEWSVNEKIAYETAIGASYVGKRALCSMKHVGLNVASDPMMTSAYLGIQGGFVLVVADDPGAYSSQNEQDSRFYAKFAKIPCFEPADSDEAKQMVVLAYELSEMMGLPVMLRSVTRLSHTASPVTLGDIRPENPISLKKDPKTMIAVPSHVGPLHQQLNQKQNDLIRWGESRYLNKIIRNGNSNGIIACGLGYAYAAEYENEFDILKISYYPFSEKLIWDFMQDLEEVWVLEEGEPIVEEIARKLSSKVKGKLSGHIKREGELGPDCMTGIFTDIPVLPITDSILKSLPPRPPVLCAGCPHGEIYKSLKSAEPNFTTGDIGCYTLGASPPYQALDTCLCMGASISQAVGISNQGINRVVSVIGDSTFFHSGIPALINAVYNKANILVMILDNSTVGMTGHQPTPGSGLSAKGNETHRVSIENICKACGVESVVTLNPYDVEGSAKIIKEKIDTPGVNVIISKAPCLFVR